MSRLFIKRVCRQDFMSIRSYTVETVFCLAINFFRGWGHLVTENRLVVGHLNGFFGPGRRKFERKFSKNSNAQGVARMLNLRFDWYTILSLVMKILLIFQPWITFLGKISAQLHYAYNFLTDWLVLFMISIHGSRVSHFRSTFKGKVSTH